VNQPQRKRTNQQRRKPQQQQRKQAPVDVWRRPADLPDLEPIALPVDVSALVRSLGDPPMIGSGAAGHYFGAVVERAAAMAVALAVSADVLADPVD
jgi:hypothetical protein